MLWYTITYKGNGGTLMNSNQMLVTFDEYEDKWQQCLTALEYDYTLSFRSACKILKCDRSWVQKYIRPITYISLPAQAEKPPAIQNWLPRQLIRN